MTPLSAPAAVSEELITFIREGKKFIIAGHIEPDGDCVGSQLALASVLKRMGKEVVLCSAGPFKRPEVKSYEHLFSSAPAEKDRIGARVILLDCTGPDRAGDLEPFIKDLPLALIDHHGTGKQEVSLDGSRNPLHFIVPDVMSTTMLVYKLIIALGMDLQREEAELLFFGICTDTGFFRHVDSSRDETFDIAACLLRAGASPKTAFAAINGGKSLNSRKLIGHILSRAESFFDGKLILSSEEYEETCMYGLEGRDSDSLYQLFQAVAGVEAIVIIRQESPEKCTVGLRSRDNVDVSRIAVFFGGGEHKNASGFSMMTTITELKPKLLEAFKNSF